ncbi:MAG: hypothetical protein E5V35_31830, partial [Mesorhizobium sp.]
MVTVRDAAQATYFALAPLTAMASLVLSRTCRIALVMAVTALLVTPADAKHRRRQPLTPRVEQPLT